MNTAYRGIHNTLKVVADFFSFFNAIAIVFVLVVPVRVMCFSSSTHGICTGRAGAQKGIPRRLDSYCR